MFYMCLCVFLFNWSVSILHWWLYLFVPSCIFSLSHYSLFLQFYWDVNPILFSFFYFSGYLDLMFLVVSMVSSYSLFIFDFWIFLVVYVYIFVCFFTFGSFVFICSFISKISKLFGGWVCVVGSSHFLCLSTHNLFLGLFFSKLSSIGVSVFLGFESL